MPVIVNTAHDDIEKQVIPCGVSQAAPLFPIANGSLIMPFQVDPNGSLFVNQQGTIPADGITPGILPIDATSYMMAWNGATWDRTGSNSSNTDNQAPTLTGNITVLSRMSVYSSSSNGWNRVKEAYDDQDSQGVGGIGKVPVVNKNLVFNGSSWDRLRTPNVFKTVSTTAAGSTALWTPAAGKKFRVMRVHMSITSNAAAAAAAVLVSQLLDGATFFGIADNNYIPLVGTIQQHQNYVFDLGNGYLSSAANNVLNINLSFALTAGILDVTVAGTEE